MSQLIQCPACEQEIPVTSERCPNCNDNTKFHIEASGGADKVIAAQSAMNAPLKHKKIWLALGITLWLISVVVVVKAFT